MPPRRRTDASWNALSPRYRRRLENSGITRAEYVRGASLSQARGHKNRMLEAERAEQRRLIRKYGPRDVEGTPQITKALLQKARKHYGDQWVTERLRQLQIDYALSEQGMYPYEGNLPYEKRSQTSKEYSRLVTLKYNYYAPFHWYRGVFG